MGRCCETCGQALPEFGGIVLDDDHRVVRHGDRAVYLQPREAQVLRVLLDQAPRVVSKTGIFDALYWRRSSDEEPDLKVVDVLVCKLRGKLRAAGFTIETHWGIGYALRDPATAGEIAT